LLFAEPGNLSALCVVDRCRKLSQRGGPAVTSKDAKLAERAKSGETAAYEEIVRAHQEVAFRTAYLTRATPWRLRTRLRRLS
jgi:hypothetical protein